MIAKLERWWSSMCFFFYIPKFGKCEMSLHLHNWYQELFPWNSWKLSGPWSCISCIFLSPSVLWVCWWVMVLEKLWTTVLPSPMQRWTILVSPVIFLCYIVSIFCDCLALHFLKYSNVWSSVKSYIFLGSSCVLKFYGWLQEKRAQRPWPKDRIWVFKSDPRFFDDGCRVE
jgi:hypothetical protein